MTEMLIFYNLFSLQSTMHYNCTVAKFMPYIYKIYFYISLYTCFVFASITGDERTSNCHVYS